LTYCRRWPRIAGVFVGFGALIVLSGRADDDAPELGMVRQVVVVGLVTLAGALIPIGIAQFGVEGNLLWRVSSACFFGLIWFTILHPTSRPLIIAQIRTDPALGCLLLAGARAADPASLDFGHAGPVPV
jgi:hypothetical protein